MAVQKGAEALIKIGNGGSPEAFTTLGGLRDTSISLNQEMIDVTNKDDSRVRKLLAQGGIKSFTVSGSGIFTDSASESTAVGLFDASTFTNIQVLIPDFKTFTGKMQLTSMEYTATYNDSVQYSITLESADTITIASV